MKTPEQKIAQLKAELKEQKKLKETAERERDEARSVSALEAAKSSGSFVSAGYALRLVNEHSIKGGYGTELSYSALRDLLKALATAEQERDRFAEVNVRIQAEVESLRPVVEACVAETKAERRRDSRERERPNAGYFIHREMDGSPTQENKEAVYAAAGHRRAAVTAYEAAQEKHNG